MLRVKVITREKYLKFIAKQPLGNFLQYPSWGEVKMEWQRELLGWFTAGNELIACTQVLYRKMPYLNRFLAYIPRGPIVDWEVKNLEKWFKPLFVYLRRKNVFSVKMDPPVLQAKWLTPSIRAYLQIVRTEGLSGRQLRDLPPDINYEAAEKVQDRLTAMGWKKSSGGGAFSTSQPDYVFRLPLQGRTLEEVYAGFHNNWKRNIKKSERMGVTVRVGSEDDLPAFYDLLLVTSERDNFQVRNLAYFQTMYKSLKAEDPNRIRLYLAEDEEDLLAATLAVHANGHYWYLYGASSNQKREKSPNHAIQWQMIQDAHAMGAHTYDFRGISPTLDEKDPLFGLLRFKLGFGGEACELIGCWDYALNPVLHWGFEYYMKHR